MTLPSPPWGYRWRSSRLFVIVTVGIGLFSDLFLYGIIVPVMPFLLRDRLGIPDADIQKHTSLQLAAYAGSSVLFAVPVGWAADRSGSRKMPFLVGIASLLVSTAMLCAGTTLTVLFTARLLQGVSVAIVWAVGFATIQDLVGSRELGKVSGSIFSFVSVGELISPALGGFLYDLGGMNAIFAGCSTVLLIDLTMRLLMLDKLEMQKYDVVSDTDYEARSDSSEGTLAAEASSDGPQETSPLLPRGNDEEGCNWKLPENTGWVARHLPVMLCMRNSRLSLAMIISLFQGTILGAIDGTVPIALSKLFSFSSNQIGLVLVCILAPFGGLGQPAGWAVDKYGPRALAALGYLLLIPAIGLLSLPTLEIIPNDAKLPVFCVMLAVNGVSLACTGPIAFVEAGSIIESYHKANPKFFGKHGPYAQLYGFNSLFFFGGLAIGPVVGGWLSEAYGFHVMTTALAGGALVMLGLVLKIIKEPLS